MPLYQYPGYAEYSGTGDVNSADSYVRKDFEINE